MTCGEEKIISTSYFFKRIQKQGKKTVLESFFNKAARLQRASFLRRDTNSSAFL